MAANGSFINQDQLKATAAEPASATAAAETAPSTTNSNLSKDEVGWYFVEQYYTTLSKTPEKLHLFYGKRSQFVYGKEAEVASVSVGRTTIQERIKELDFQDCKVRVTNVDSMASFENIVIQVIGETSNRSGEPQKFVQTFVLAPQPSGYFVVNDILRFVNEEADEEAVAETTEEHVADSVVSAVESQIKQSVETEQTSEPEAVPKAEEAPKEATPSNGEPATAVPEIAKPEAVPEPEAAAVEPTPDPETAAVEVAEEDVKEPEKPVDPQPTPVAAAQPVEKPRTPRVALPAKPMSWASRAAAAVGPKPVVPLPKTSTPPAQGAKAPAPAPAAAAPAGAAPAAAAAAQQPAAAPAQQPAEQKESAQGSAEWTSVTDSKRQNRPQSISGAPAENPGTLGYVKYVTEKVKTEDLRAALANHGELTYFDVNRQKNCAFVEFATVAGYQAAVAANPHTVNGENIVVEPRRPKAGAYGGSNYSTTRGGAANRGRGGFEGQRQGSQGSGRGGFTGGQGRGRGGAPRGRGPSQATNA